MTNNNNNINTTTFSNTDCWIKVLNKDAVMDTAIMHMLESIFNTVLYNTALKTMVTESVLTNFKEVFDNMVDTSGVLFIETNIESRNNEKFIFSDYRRKWGKESIYRSLVKIFDIVYSNGIWFEDTKESKGFCCKTNDGIVYTLEMKEKN